MPSFRIPPLMRKEDDPERDKFILAIEPYGPDKDYLDIIMSVELSTDEEIENRAYNEFETQGKILEFNYLVKMNLTEIKNDLAKLLAEAYVDPRWDILLDEPLKKLNLGTTQALLAPIAEEGSLVYYKLFESDNIIPISHKNDNEGVVRKAILSALNRVGIVHIKRKEELDGAGKGKMVDPLFPWAFLYTDASFKKTSPETLNPYCFWGFRYEIQELFSFTSKKKKLPLRPKMVAAICPDLDEERHYMDDHPFVKYADRIDMTPTPSIEELGQALNNFTSDCLYFYGHAHHEEPTKIKENCLTLKSRNLTVYGIEANYKAPNFSGEPILAFLNGCHTAPLSTWNNESVVGLFCDRSQQQLCCVLTVAKIPKLFALEFGKHFWEEFLTQQYIGRALLNARIKMLGQYNNPLGLIYSLFGCVDTQLMPKPKS